MSPETERYARTCLERSAAVAKTGNHRLDVAYGDDPRQVLDIYRPSGARGVPVMLFFHGGGFTHGQKEWCGFMAPAINAIPAIFVSASYRLVPAVSYRDILRDAFAALDYVRRNIAGDGGDPDRIFLAGHSAGATIVSLMALRHDWRAEAGLPADSFRAVLPISGRYSRRLSDSESDPALRVDATVPDSALELAPNVGTPFYVTWGGREDEERRRIGRDFAAALERAKAKVEWEEFPEEDHYTIHLATADPDNAWVRKARQWMLAS
jgi:arylformamidase